MLNTIAKTLIVFIFTGSIISCGDTVITSNFEDQEKLSIYDYIVLNKEKYSSFLSILEVGKIAPTLRAYNPNNTDYTLFLPDNNAIEKYITEIDRGYTSLEDLLADTAYVEVLARYHVIDKGYSSNDFPFGAFSEYTLSGDQLTVSFVTEFDTSVYKINNQAPVIFKNIELSNGFIQVIGSTLKPIIYTTYGWLANKPGFTIFKEAVDATGLQALIDINVKEDITNARAFTLMVEHDTIFQKNNINSFEDLANYISPGNTDYANLSNPLNNFVRYHFITVTRFLDNFVNDATNYSTFSEIPLNINGYGMDIGINKGKQNFDTIVSASGDTTIIDYIGFNFDASNVLTQSGVIHFIDQLMEIQSPSRAIMTFEFYEEPMFNEFRKEPNRYIVEDSSALLVMEYVGSDLFFIESGDATHSAWGKDYISINGDFVISYTLPKIVQGEYKVVLGAQRFNTANAKIEVNIDGKNIGGLINLTTGGDASWPFRGNQIGTIEFIKYEQHVVEVRSLIPGLFEWDYIRFEPK